MILPSSTNDRKSPVPSDEKPGPSSTEDEKQIYESQTISLVDSSDGDEALKLVGREREVQFSDEYNRKLRNKLVRAFILYLEMAGPHHLPNFGYLGSYHPPIVCCCIFHAIPVGPDVVDGYLVLKSGLSETRLR